MRLLRWDRVSPTRAQRRAFTCGVPELDRWLAEQARQSLDSRDAVTYLLLDDVSDPSGDPTSWPIAGYFALSAGEIRRADAPGALGVRAPDPIPVVRMGRFAIATGYQAQGWGAELLREALLSAAAAGTGLGARLILVDAMGPEARQFYRRFGFVDSPAHPLQVLHDLRVVAVSAGAEEA